VSTFDPKEPVSKALYNEEYYEESCGGGEFFRLYGPRIVKPLVGKVMCLLFNMPSRLVIGFLPRSKCFLISWLQSPSAVILEPKK